MAQPPLRHDAGESSAGLPTGPAGRLLAFGILALLLLALWFGLVLPLVAWRQDHAETLSQRAAIARRMEQIVAGLPNLERAAQAAGTQALSQQSLLTQPSDSIAAASLLQIVQDLAVSAGSQLSSTETLPAEPAGAYRRIRLRIALSAQLPVVVDFLRMLSVSMPRIIVDDLQLRAAPVLIGRDSPPLDATMLIVAFRSGDAAP